MCPFFIDTEVSSPNREDFGGPVTSPTVTKLNGLVSETLEMNIDPVKWVIREVLGS